MKDLIKKILREETLDLKPALIKAFYGFMEMETQGYEIYVDIPENRFRYNPESIWIINPKTKGWIIGLLKSGKLWYYGPLYDNFLNWFNEERSVFEQLIRMWVEDVLKRGVLTIPVPMPAAIRSVGDVLKRGILTTRFHFAPGDDRVEDVLKKGIKIS
jgi:hypothetical protein